MKTFLTLAVMLLVLALAGCLPTAPEPTPAPAPPPTPLPAPTPPPLSPAEVVTGTAERLSAGDLEGGMAYWADDAIWYIFGLPPNGSELIQGKDDIRAEFASEIAAHLKWEIEPDSVVGNVVTSHDKTWLDFTRQIGVAPVQATGQFLVEDGKISTYAWTIDAESLGKLKAALAEAMPAEQEAEPASNALAKTQVSDLTVTIAGGTCSIEKPVILKAGDVQLTVDVKDENRQGYAVVFLTLDPGKDFTDLMAASTGSPPSWSHALHYEEVGPATSRTYKITLNEGPLYGICFSKPPDHAIGNLGPFEVSQ